ncbi:MAG TPA: carboxypeptidase-like regulatory domain-containing protein, partial [Verrucomicrobiae bacterium]|nr:carboxypeptidase-like regulatory domain-containing protein [Verrucomicrobiae bacterium]
IQSNAQITADGGGFYTVAGLGTGSSGTSAQGYLMGTGGSYGGYGGASALSGAPGVSYGSITHPINPGSGGGVPNSNLATPQTAGGGTVQMTVSGTLDLEGSISANGMSPTAEGSGGGSGGSIQLTALTLTGAGTISANGGGGVLPYSGGGGGGRIAVYYTTNKFTGKMFARGGQGYAGGGAGTIYSLGSTNTPAGNGTNTITSVNIGAGTVLVDNGGLRGTNTLLTTPEAFYLTVSGGAIVETPPTNSTLADPTLFLSSLVVQSNGSITTPTANDNASLIIYGDALVASNATISTDGQGYDGFGSNGPGAGQMATNGSGSGGGHGGNGGASASGESGGLAYDSSLQPINWGSQGGVPSTNFTSFSQGGGAIRMDVAGTLTVNGTITANGKSAVFPETGGGAGGSVWVEAGTLAGSGAITANGGAGEPSSGGGGGGGRIALYYATNSFSGSLNAAGAAGASAGQNGSIVSVTLVPPQIISQSPSGPTTNAVSSVILNLDSQASLISSGFFNATITTPNGVLPVEGVSYASSNMYPQDFSQLIVSFPAQTAVGIYTIAVTQVADLFGLFAPAYTNSFTIAQPIISGTITDTNDSPISGATIQPTDGIAATTTDANGNYFLSVPLGWSGTLTPSASGYVIVSASASYTNLVASATQNFLATPPSAFALNATPQSSGVNLAWFGARGVNYRVYYSTNLIDWHSYGVIVNGANQPVSVNVPATNGPKMFFRFGAQY